MLKDAALKMLLPMAMKELPGLLPQILKSAVDAIIASGGGDPANCACMLWHGKRADGTETIMATVYRLTATKEPGEEVAILDVNELAAQIDLNKFVDK